MQRALPSPRRGGFSLLELVIVASLLSILAGTLAPSLRRHAARARDVRRLADVRAICAAIDDFYADTGRWPAAESNAAYGNWDVSHDGSFVGELRSAGYLIEDGRDPKNDDTFHYRYYVYPRGAHGCGGGTPYYVIGIRRFESESFAAENSGFFTCVGRDWNAEFDYVTGGGATF